MEQSEKAVVGLTAASILKGALLTARPRQWTKNLLIFVPLLFTVTETWDAGNPAPVLSTAIAFLIFCGLSGAVYMVNDLFDVEQDRRHPRKRNRPIASGRLPVQAAWASAVVLVAGGVAGGFVMEPLFGLVAAVYVATMLAYTLVIKQLVLLDVVTISAGFVLRAVAGAVVLEVPVSPWLYICTGLGALFIALSKRRSELAAAGDGASAQRGTLALYSLPLLDQLISVVAAATVLAYSLYTFTASNLPDNHAMMLTIPFVVYGLFRYLYLVHTSDMGEHPEELLLNDRPFALSVLLWLLASGLILVFFKT